MMKVSKLIILSRRYLNIDSIFSIRYSQIANQVQSEKHTKVIFVTVRQCGLARTWDEGVWTVLDVSDIVVGLI